MLEPLYGTGLPMWTAVSSPGFTWPIPVGSSQLSGSMGLNPAMPGQVAVLQGQSPFGVPGAYPSQAIGPDGPAATASTLLAAVAMRRGQPLGPTNDQEIEDFFYDALEVFPGAGEVEVRSEGGRVSLTGRVQHKKLKRDIGEIAWATPGVNDVHNNLTITARRRPRGAGREQEPSSAARKPA